MKSVIYIIVLLCVISLIPCPPIVKAEDSCGYGSTQARVQLDINDPWKPSITIDPLQQFNVGGFHNETGEFANDITINVNAPGFNMQATNGETINNLQPGTTYLVHVTTNDQSSWGCEETATVYVTGNPISATPIQPDVLPFPLPENYCQYSTYFSSEANSTLASADKGSLVLMVQSYLSNTNTSPITFHIFDDECKQFVLKNIDSQNTSVQIF